MERVTRLLVPQSRTNAIPTPASHMMNELHSDIRFANEAAEAIAWATRASGRNPDRLIRLLFEMRKKINRLEAELEKRNR